VQNIPVRLVGLALVAASETAVAAGIRWGGLAGGGRDDPCAGAGGFSAGCVCEDAPGVAGDALSRGGSGAEAPGGEGAGSTHSIFGDDALRAGTRFSARSAAEAGTRRENFLMLLR
jgi:hypothetical protein